jgi:glycosyltransferase involved in cell wall biosynthesis
LQEAFGQTSLEAMACGIPVVGFNVGGIPDMVMPEITGLLAQPEDTDDLARKILWMIDNPEKKKAMGNNARKMVVENFSMEILGSKYLELYQSILSKDA